ncbi:hypothetical protein [Parasedimentitalea maritima]|uniref:Uncharacterized protein n=1 Tax=Parasedimentitalea maritima TaxID=2578117 RepID=A0A6A4RFY3_9RHOB|nr:hypothetical protein [Zongyanglinia marina]KAE9628462.1 hypothetical protein GP644_14865 [Zongyanglinia marina]
MDPKTLPTHSVNFIKDKGLYLSVINVNRGQIALGFFENPYTTVLARSLAAEWLGWIELT